MYKDQRVKVSHSLFFSQQKQPLELIRRRLVFLATVYFVNPSSI